MASHDTPPKLNGQEASRRLGSSTSSRALGSQSRKSQISAQSRAPARNPPKRWNDIIPTGFLPLSLRSPPTSYPTDFLGSKPSRTSKSPQFWSSDSEAWALQPCSAAIPRCRHGLWVVHWAMVTHYKVHRDRVVWPDSQPGRVRVIVFNPINNRVGFVLNPIV